MHGIYCGRSVFPYQLVGRGLVCCVGLHNIELNINFMYGNTCKVKLTRYTLWKVLGGRGGITPLFLNSALDGGEWWLLCPGRALPPGKEPHCTLCTGGCVGSRAGWAQRVEEKFSASVGDRTPVAQSVVSHCTDRATRLDNTFIYIHIYYINIISQDYVSSKHPM
jgi:hypothetical protein